MVGWSVCAPTQANYIIKWWGKLNFGYLILCIPAENKFSIFYLGWGSQTPKYDFGS